MSVDASAHDELAGSNGQDDVRELLEELRAEVADLRAENERLAERVDDLKSENEELRTRLDAVEDAREREPTLSWESPAPTDLVVEHPDRENTFALGESLAWQFQVSDLEERVEELEDGRADVVVRGELDDDVLPIENRLAREKAGDDSLGKSERRASVLFPAFGNAAETRGGKKLVLTSTQAKTILQERTDKQSWHDETIKRAMAKLAELTSRGENRDARDGENLLTLKTPTEDGTRFVELHADREAFQEFLQEVSQR